MLMTDFFRIFENTYRMICSNFHAPTFVRFFVSEFRPGEVVLPMIGASYSISELEMTLHNAVIFIDKFFFLNCNLQIYGYHNNYNKTNCIIVIIIIIIILHFIRKMETSFVEQSDIEDETNALVWSIKMGVLRP